MEKKNNNLIGVLVFIFAAVVSYSIVTGDVKKKDVNLSEQIKTNFMAGCIKDGNYDYCLCTFNKLGASKVATLEKQYTDTGTLPQELTDVAYQCVTELTK